MHNFNKENGQETSFFTKTNAIQNQWPAQGLKVSRDLRTLSPGSFITDPELKWSTGVDNWDTSLNSFERDRTERVNFGNVSS